MQSNMESKNETIMYDGSDIFQPPIAPPPYPGPPKSHPSPYPHMVQPLTSANMPNKIAAHKLESKSTVCVCKYCHHQIVTRVEPNDSLINQLLSLFCCVIGCWPIACLPLCIDLCSDGDHYCTNCDAYLGSFVMS